MTVKELINALQNLGEEAQEKKIVIFDGPCYGTPSRVEVLGEEWTEGLRGNILID